MRLLFLTSLLIPLLAPSAAGQPGGGEEPLPSRSTETAATTIGGYGNALFQRDLNAEMSRMNFERFVLFVGHKFRSSLSLFSELEVEDAKVTGGESGGEFALEQAYLRFDLDRHNYFVAGLFLPRIGIMNEDHLPTGFNGNERTVVETYVIPSAWRELGVGYYGSLEGTPFSYSLALLNGLRAENFEHGSGIRMGRAEGRDAPADNLALTCALQFRAGNFLAQVSGYVGGTAGSTTHQADSLTLPSGPFGTPVMVGEASVQYEEGGVRVRMLGAVVSIPDAEGINRAYANNTPQKEYGLYAEIGYDLFTTISPSQQLIAFVRYERLDLNAVIPPNGIPDGTLDQHHLVVGLTYLPHPNVVTKLDVRFVRTGEPNPALIVDPGPAAVSYRTSNALVSIGIGFSF